MSVKFEIGKVGEKEKHTPPKSQKDAINIMVARLGTKGPFRVAERGGTRWMRHDEAGLRRLLRAQFSQAAPGQAFLCRSGLVMHVARAVETVVPVELPAQSVDWPNTQKVLYQDVYGRTWENGKPYYLGTCNCRPTRQGGSLSDHACCAALDVGVGANKKLGDEIYAFYSARKAQFGIRYISWQVAFHYDHLHISTGSCSGCV